MEQNEIELAELEPIPKAEPDTQEPPSTEQSATSLEQTLAEERRMRLLSENKLLCISLLDTYSLPRELCDVLVSDNADETQKRVESVAKFVKKAINEQVKARLATVSTPTQKRTAMTSAEFKNLSLSERQKLYQTDRELYKQLSNKF